MFHGIVDCKKKIDIVRRTSLKLKTKIKLSMKIISYSIFGEEQWYRNGLIKNIEIAKSLLKDWTVRVYMSDKIEKEFINKVSKNNNVEVIIKNEKYPYEGLMWRMLPMEEGHEVVAVRDCDTRLFQRDKNLLDDWISNKFKYHVCRENPGAYSVILAGLYGGKKPNLIIEDKFHKWRETYLKGKKSLYLYDQGFLSRHVYPHIRNDLIVYTEHVKMDCEENVKKIPGDRGLYKGRYIHLGMYIEDDFVKSDENKSLEDTKEFGQSRNVQRLQYIEEDKKFNPDDHTMKIYKPLFKYESFIINSVYLFFDIIFNSKLNIFSLLYIFFCNKIVRKFIKIKYKSHNLNEYYK